MSEELNTLDKFLKNAVGKGSELREENLEVWVSGSCDIAAALSQAWHLVSSNKVRSISFKCNEVRVKIER